MRHGNIPGGIGITLRADNNSTLAELEGFYPKVSLQRTAFVQRNRFYSIELSSKRCRGPRCMLALERARDKSGGLEFPGYRLAVARFDSSTHYHPKHRPALPCWQQALATQANSSEARLLPKFALVQS